MCCCEAAACIAQVPHAAGAARLALVRAHCCVRSAAAAAPFVVLRPAARLHGRLLPRCTLVAPCSRPSSLRPNPPLQRPGAHICGLFMGRCRRGQDAGHVWRRPQALLPLPRPAAGRLELEPVVGCSCATTGRLWAVVAPLRAVDARGRGGWRNAACKQGGIWRIAHREGGWFIAGSLKM